MAGTLIIHTRSCKEGKPGNFGVFRNGWGLYDWLKKRELINRSEFAPSQALLKSVKTGLSFEKFRERYIQEMREHKKANPQTWDQLLAHEEITLCCFEHDPRECHRSILAELIQKWAEFNGLTVTMDIQ